MAVREVAWVVREDKVQSGGEILKKYNLATIASDKNLAIDKYLNTLNTKTPFSSWKAAQDSVGADSVKVTITDEVLP